MYNYIIFGLIICLLLIFTSNYKIFNNSKRHKIIICMSYTDNISSYSKHTEYLNKKYAEKHGYGFVKYNVELNDRAQQWCKVKTINDLLQKNIDYDYIFWIDSDAFFNNFNKSLDSIIDKYTDKDIIICDDIPNSGKKNTINTGTMFIKCSEWSKQFCNEWFNYEGEFLHTHYHEQSVLENYINNDINDFKKHIKIYPTKTFNSDANELNEYKKTDDLIIHLMARTPEIRVYYIQKWMKDNQI